MLPTDNFWVTLIQQVAFPVFVAAYLLVYMARRLDNLADAIRLMAQVILAVNADDPEAKEVITTWLEKQLQDSKK